MAKERIKRKKIGRKKAGRRRHKTEDRKMNTQDTRQKKGGRE